MKKVLCGIMVVAACAGALTGYYDVSTNPNTRGVGGMTFEKETMRSLRARSTIEADIKDTEKKMHDLDKRIGQERNMVKKMDLQKERAGDATHLKKLEDELMRAK